MGASKRFCEMIIQSMKESKTEYVAVRFARIRSNDLLSFTKQIDGETSNYTTRELSAIL